MCGKPDSDPTQHDDEPEPEDLMDPASRAAYLGEDPLTCRQCPHPIEDHHPSEYGRDVCVGAGYRSPVGVVCPCQGFTLTFA